MQVYFFASCRNYESSKYYFMLIIIVMKAYVFNMTPTLQFWTEWLIGRVGDSWYLKYERVN